MSVEVTEVDYLVEVVDKNTVTVNTSTEPKVVVVGVMGPQGIQGIQGTQGVPGPAGFTYVHDQSVPSASWNIVHNMSGFPNVTIVDSSGAQVEGEVLYIDNNTIEVTFAGGFSGKAYLS